MERFNTTKYGYKYDKIIFSGGMLLILAFIFVIACKQNFDFSNKIFFKCEGLMPCENPMKDLHCSREWLYGKDCNIKCEGEWCGQDMLSPGEYGEKSPNYIRGFLFFCLFCLASCFGINHLWHNVGVPFDLEIKFTENKRINLRDMFKYAGKMEDEYK